MDELLKMIDEAIEMNDSLQGDVLDKWVIARLESDGSCLAINVECQCIAQGLASATLFDLYCEAKPIAELYRNGNGKFTAMQVREINKHVRDHLTALKANLTGANL